MYIVVVALVGLDCFGELLVFGVLPVVEHAAGASELCLVACGVVPSGGGGGMLREAGGGEASVFIE